MCTSHKTVFDCIIHINKLTIFVCACTVKNLNKITECRQSCISIDTFFVRHILSLLLFCDFFTADIMQLLCYSMCAMHYIFYLLHVRVASARQPYLFVRFFGFFFWFFVIWILFLMPQCCFLLCFWNVENNKWKKLNLNEKRFNIK